MSDIIIGLLFLFFKKPSLYISPRPCISWTQAPGECRARGCCTEEATGKAIEIQSISRCQEKIKGQIAFLIRAEALR